MTIRLTPSPKFSHSLSPKFKTIRLKKNRALWTLAISVAAVFAVAIEPAKLAAQQGEDEQYANSVEPLSAEQIEQLVAPIALYPDTLIAQILAASTYPAQVAEADRWRHSQNYLSHEAIAEGVSSQPWDPSVMALTAFPSVLTQMDRNMQWTSDLGNAYYNQPQDVLEAVQIMRRRAREVGNLHSSPQEVVRNQPSYIELAPVNPEVVYVPTYNPWTVYGEPVSPYPGFSLLDAVGEFLGSSALRYGAGIAMSAFAHTPFGWFAWGLDWLAQSVLFDHSDYYSHSNTVADWGFNRHQQYAYSGGRNFGRPGFHNATFRGRENWRRTGYSGNGWHSFGRTRSEGWGTQSSRGFQSFRNTRGSYGGFGSSSHSDFRDGRSTYASNFLRPPTAGFPRRDSFSGNSGFQHQRFGNRSTESFANSTFAGSRLHGSTFSARTYGSSGRSSHSSSGFHSSNSGHSPRNSGSKGWGGFRSRGGGGHAPKSFGGGHSRGGGHSGGGHSGGGSKRHR